VQTDFLPALKKVQGAGESLLRVRFRLATFSPVSFHPFGDRLPLRHGKRPARDPRSMGVKEFAAKLRMASPNVLRAINPHHNPTQDTLNRLLRPFSLRLALAPLAPSKGRRAP